MDKYDEAVAYLTQHPERIRHAWNYPDTVPGGCLFLFAGDVDSDTQVGCLTQVKTGYYHAQTPALTEKIRADHRLPYDIYSITVEHLPVFASWQRKLDRYAFRKKKRSCTKS